MTAIKDNRKTGARAGSSPLEETPTADLSDARQRLVGAVETAVRQADSTALVVTEPARGACSLEPVALLALLTFWYARQVYSSTQIVARLKLDLACCGRAGGMLLEDAGALRRFRAVNRLPLESALATTLRLVAEDKVLQGRVTHVNGNQFAEEARRRVTMAIFTDTLETEPQPVELNYIETSFTVANE